MLNLTFAVTLILASFILSGLILNFSFQKVFEQRAWVRHSAEVIGKVDFIHIAIKEAESAGRGYLITKNDDMQKTFRNGIIEANEHLTHLQRLTQDNISQHKLP